jgi:hypothetical protein
MLMSYIPRGWQERASVLSVIFDGGIGDHGPVDVELVEAGIG